MKLVGGYGCISFLSVKEGALQESEDHGESSPDPVEGTSFACMAAITEFRFKGRETRTWTWNLAARTTSGQLLDPGEYVLEAVLTVAGLEAPTAVFRVADGG